MKRYRERQLFAAGGLLSHTLYYLTHSLLAPLSRLDSSCRFVAKSLDTSSSSLLRALDKPLGRGIDEPINASPNGILNASYLALKGLPNEPPSAPPDGLPTGPIAGSARGPYERGA